MKVSNSCSTEDTEPEEMTKLSPEEVCWEEARKERKIYRMLHSVEK
jgi:hypothetical protein